MAADRWTNIRPDQGAGTATPIPPAPSRRWRSCGYCWGQRRVHHMTRDGLVARPCPACLGLGDVYR